MLCWPIKIQSFADQTSKFTRPLGNVLAPLTQTLEWGQSPSLLLSNSCGNFVFCSFENYNERQEIDRGISVRYQLWPFTICRGLKEERFTSTLSARYLTEEDLHFLPEGPKKLVMNMIARLRTPERVVVQRFWSCTPGLSELFDNFRYCAWLVRGAVCSCCDWSE